MNQQTITTRTNTDQIAAASRQPTAKDKNRLASSSKSTSAGEKKYAATSKTIFPGVESAASQRLLSAGGASREVVFRFEAPSAKNVLVAGEFSDWEKAPIKMVRSGRGVWLANVSLPPGRHLYRLLVDGVWENDPNCHERVANPFGTYNDVVKIS